MYGYRKERIEECVSALRGEKRMKGGWGELVRQIHAVAEVLESPDQEIAVSAQEKVMEKAIREYAERDVAAQESREPVQGKRRLWSGFRTFGTA